MFLLLMQFLILNIDKLIGKDIPIGVITELILTNLAYMVVLAAPMAVLVATLMAFGKFSELNELTALRASGVNTIKIIQPVLVAALLLCIGLAWFSNSVLPEANNKARSLFIDIRIKKPGFELQPNIFYDGIEGYTFLVKEISKETDSLYNVTLFQEPRNNKTRALIKSRKGFLMSEGDQGLTLMLYDGEIFQDQVRNNRTGDNNIEKTVFDQYRITFDLSDLEFSKTDPSQRTRSDRTMSAQAMAVVVDTLQKEIRTFHEEAATSTSFKNLTTALTEDFRTIPKRVTRIFPGDTLAEKPAFQSPYFSLNQVQNQAQQKNVLDIAQNRLEEHQSTFSQATSNILWRTRRVNKFMVEIFKKVSIPFACVVFILLGAPIGIMTKRGNFGYAAIISTVILTIYWLSIIQGEKLADRLFITPFWGMWTFDIVFSIIGILMIIHLSTEISFTRFLKKSE